MHVHKLKHHRWHVATHTHTPQVSPWNQHIHTSTCRTNSPIKQCLCTSFSLQLYFSFSKLSGFNFSLFLHNPSLRWNPKLFFWPHQYPQILFLWMHVLFGVVLNKETLKTEMALVMHIYLFESLLQSILLYWYTSCLKLDSCSFLLFFGDFNNAWRDIYYFFFKKTFMQSTVCYFIVLWILLLKENGKRGNVTHHSFFLHGSIMTI